MYITITGKKILWFCKIRQFVEIISFTIFNKYGTITKANLHSKLAIYTYSSGDRAMPSGGMCGGSTPPRRVFFMG